MRVREVSCRILSQCSLKCGGRGVRLCFVICRCFGAMFFRRWCVMRSAWDLWALRSDLSLCNFWHSSS